MISIAYSRTLFTFEKETIDALLNKISGGETINWKTEHINVTYARWMYSVDTNLYHICKDLNTKEVKILDFCRRVIIVKDEERNMKYGFVFLTLHWVMIKHWQRLHLIQCITCYLKKQLI